MKGGVMTHDEMADKVRELERQLAHAQRERDHWKASYQDMVAELSKSLAQLQQQLADLTSRRNRGDV
jgi:prefoldin subunit 5